MCRSPNGLTSEFASHFSPIRGARRSNARRACASCRNGALEALAACANAGQIGFDRRARPDYSHSRALGVRRAPIRVLQISIVADYQEDLPSHDATDAAILHAARFLGINYATEW